MKYSPNVNVAVYQVLDEVLCADVVPSPGSPAEIHSIVDDRRGRFASPELIGLAECISLRLHTLSPNFDAT